MRSLVPLLLIVPLLFAFQAELFSQGGPMTGEFGIIAAGFTNFPASRDYLKKDISVICVSPYLRTGQHEFTAGILYPLQTHGLYFTDKNISPRPGFLAGYKFYVFNAGLRENLFIHYMFQYLRFRGEFETYYNQIGQTFQWTEKDTYINNVIGLGYSLFFDTGERFGMFYTLDYVISQHGYAAGTPGFNGDSWTTSYSWNNLSTQVGFCFKLTSLEKKQKK